jgi:hypothetical protein
MVQMRQIQQGRKQQVTRDSVLDLRTPSGRALPY